MAKRQSRVWGQTLKGAQFVTGLTARELVDALTRCIETPDGDGRRWAWEDEICLAIDPCHGLPGKALEVKRGTFGQLWIVGFVVDESLANGETPPRMLKEVP